MTTLRHRLAHVPLPLFRSMLLRHERGGRAARHELATLYSRLPLNMLRHAALTHSARRAGVSFTRGPFTPTRNVIGLSSPVAVRWAVEMGEPSPWRSIVPPRGGGGARGTRWQSSCGRRT
jgi:hypothetical protein